MHRNPRRWARLASPFRPLLVLPLLAALSAAPGCVTQPAITVHHAEVRGLSMSGMGVGMAVTIFLQVRNDNAYDVQIRSVHCNVTFGRGNVLGPIDFAPNQWLGSNRTTLVAVPVWIPMQLLPALAAETAGSYAVPYHVVGTADVTATRAFGIERNNYPIDEGGSVPRQMLVDSARSAIPLPF
jgi:hypothetical protein